MACVLVNTARKVWADLLCSKHPHMQAVDDALLGVTAILWRCLAGLLCKNSPFILCKVLQGDSRPFKHDPLQMSCRAVVCTAKMKTLPVSQLHHVQMLGGMLSAQPTPHARSMMAANAQDDVKTSTNIF